MKFNSDIYLIAAKEHVTAALASQHAAWSTNVMRRPVSHGARELGGVTPPVASRLVERERGESAEGVWRERKRPTNVTPIPSRLLAWSQRGTTARASYLFRLLLKLPPSYAVDDAFEERDLLIAGPS